MLDPKEQKEKDAFFEHIKKGLERYRTDDELQQFIVIGVSYEELEIVGRARLHMQHNMESDAIAAEYFRAVLENVNKENKITEHKLSS